MIPLAVRWYLRYPLAYEHVTELLAERGLAVDRSCVWRWVQAYGVGAQQALSPSSKTSEQELPRRRDLDKGERKRDVFISCGGFQRADH